MRFSDMFLLTRLGNNPFCEVSRCSSPFGGQENSAGIQ